MGKFNLALWRANQTIQENADRMGIHYNYASVLSRIHSLPHVRQRTGPQNRRLYIKRKPEVTISEPLLYGKETYHVGNFWVEDKPYKKEMKNFTWEGSD